ncbi:hypothetical protein Tco_1443666 [Tanacetum coccineum]
MHQFWNTINKIRDTYAYNFKLDKKKCRVDTEVFREILQICPKLPNQDFVEPPSEEELDTFIQELGYSGKCDMLSGMYNQKNLDYVVLLWEGFMYQTDNTEICSARKEHMPYLRFTKVIINHFISKDKTISMRNRINIHTIHDDSLLGTLKFVSKTEDYHKYRALIPDGMINQDIKDSKAYKTYYDFATRKATPKKARKFRKFASLLRKLSPILEEEHAVNSKRAKRPTKKSTIMPTTSVVIRDTPSEYVSKKKTPTKVDRSNGMDLLSNVALLKAAQLKKTLKKSKMETHKLHASCSGTGTKPGVPDVPKYLSESENESWGDSGDDDSDEVNKDNDEDDVESDADDDNEASDSEKTDFDEDENPNLNQNDNEEEEHEEEYVRTLDSIEFTDDDDDEEY